MTASSQNQPSKSPCRIAWCLWDACTGDHFASPGDGAWRGVVATGDPEQRAPLIAPAPTWGQSEGLDPAVVVYIDGGERRYDISIDLRPGEARRLAFELTRSAEAAERSLL